MKAIVDCNNFYCSCERLFRPELADKPVVVLSNNDGCIISRSDEAKKLGVEMGIPYFLARPLIEQHGIQVFSSNYNLYGDLSWRVMETLRQMLGSKRVEVYSVDEAFLDLQGLTEKNWHQLAMEIRSRVWEWTGIQVSVGIAPSKVLSKLANRLAKKDKVNTGCVYILEEAAAIEKALQLTDVADLWGIGRRYAKKLKEDWGIYDAWQLSHVSEEFARQQLGGVVGVRLWRELRGESCREMEEELVQKKMIATTRMFGRAVNDRESIREAVATYTSRAAEKLRRQHGAARLVEVFVVTREQSHDAGFRHGATLREAITLPRATSNTHELIKPAIELVDKLYQKDQWYKKAGVMLGNIVPDNSIQGNLFGEDIRAENRQLMEVVDNINFSQRDDILKFARSGTTRNWKMRQELRSPRYTTRWEELARAT
jgi:DNA polymerase V